MVGILNKNEIESILEAIERDWIDKLGNTPDGKAKKDGRDLVNKVLDTLHSEPFPVYVKLGEARICGEELTKLQPGDIIILDDEELKDIAALSVSGKPVPLGRIDNHVQHGHIDKIKDQVSVKLKKNKTLRNNNIGPDFVI
ncbi:MAG: hypothetical protein A2017_05370 [Lentisphaerae bacterium GWF2_44_16]|nr:MAG: hypothetical protein A2017_05370 [Lentisphaerae bacterium GWF2_44_16]